MPRSPSEKQEGRRKGGLFRSGRRKPGNRGAGLPPDPHPDRQLEAYAAQRQSALCASGGTDFVGPTRDRDAHAARSGRVNRKEASMAGLSLRLGLGSSRARAGDPDPVPDPFFFADQSDVPLSTLTESNSIIVAGVSGGSPISVTGGEYRIGSGSWTSSPGTIQNGESAKVRHISSASNSTATNSVLTIGGVSDTFTTTTEAAVVSGYPVVEFDGANPDRFAQASASLGADGTTCTIALLNFYSASVPLGNVTLFGAGAQRVSVRILTSGKIRFTVSNGAAVNFALVDTTSNVCDGVARDIVCTFDTTQAVGTDGAKVMIRTVGGSWSAGGAAPGAWATDTIDFSQASAYAFGGATAGSGGFNGRIGAFYLNTAAVVTPAAGVDPTFDAANMGTNGTGPTGSAPNVLLVGTKAQWEDAAGLNWGSGGKFIKITGAAVDNVSGSAWGSITDTVPEPFTFTDQTNVGLSTVTESNEIIVDGINAAAAISIAGGEYQIEGGSWTSSSGTVTNGQTVKVRHTSSGSNATAVNSVLTIGGVSDTFTSTTLSAVDETPNQFTFTDVTGVALSTLQTSNTITVAGLGSGVSVAVSVTGGEYSKNGGGYTSAAGTAQNSDTFAVRHSSSASNSTGTNTILTIGGVTDTYTSVTLAGVGGGEYDHLSTDAQAQAAAVIAHFSDNGWNPDPDAVSYDDTITLSSSANLRSWVNGSSVESQPLRNATRNQKVKLATSGTWTYASRNLIDIRGLDWTANGKILLIEPEAGSGYTIITSRFRINGARGVYFRRIAFAADASLVGDTEIFAPDTLKSVTITTPGSGYVVGEAITFTGTFDEAPVATISSVDGSGGITGIEVTYGGKQIRESQTRVLQLTGVGVTTAAGTGAVLAGVVDTSDPKGDAGVIVQIDRTGTFPLLSCAIFADCKFGAEVAASPNNDPKKYPTAFKAQNIDQLYIINCFFDGYRTALKCTTVRLLKVHGTDFQRNLADIMIHVNTGATSSGYDTVYPDKLVWNWARLNTARNYVDACATLNSQNEDMRFDQLHTDFWQMGNTDDPGGFRYLIEYNAVYGERVTYMDRDENNRNFAPKELRVTGGTQGIFTSRDHTPGMNGVTHDNIIAVNTTNQYVFTSGRQYIEHNTGVRVGAMAPSATTVPDGYNYSLDENSAVRLKQPPGGEAVIYTRNNIVGSISAEDVGITHTASGNVLADPRKTAGTGTTYADVFQGTFTTDSEGRQAYTLDDTTAVATFRADLYAQLAPESAHAGKGAMDPALWPAS